MSANPLTSTLAALIESAANAALGTSGAARDGLAALDGQILLLEFSTLPSAPPTGIRIHCLAAEGGTLRVMADTAHNTRAPTTIVRGTLPDLIAALFRDDLPATVSIDGDERLLLALKRCFANLQPQWRERFEELVERMQGFAGASGAPLVQDLLGQAELAFDTLRTSLGDLLGAGSASAGSAGARFWAQDSDLDDFATRLENLQLSIDRLQAQVEQLQSSAPDTESA